ncbi:MAG: hypothetical protein WC208_15995 [Gallionella sp.]|jgi:hypothetical protein
MIANPSVTTLLYSHDSYKNRGEVIRGEVIRGEVIRGEVIRGEVIRGEVIRGEVIRGEVIRYITSILLLSHGCYEKEE